MSTRIAVIGTGYVGLISAVGLADFGNTVIGADIDESKIHRLSAGEPVIYEPGLAEYLRKNLDSGRLSFTSDVGQAVRSAAVVFNTVGTPALSSGEVDLSQVYSVIDLIRENLNGYKTIVTKSTVPVGTNRQISQSLRQSAGGEQSDVVSNPEFLREGKAVQDFFHPDRIVIGCESERARSVMSEIYRPLYLIERPFVWCGLETAELIKYASNAFLATKVTFMNQVANLCEEVGADVHTVARAIGMDGRIGSKFLHPGPGYGGSCLPKDTAALVKTGERHGMPMTIVQEVILANRRQPTRIVAKLERGLGSLRGKNIAVLGLAYKAETDDVRDSPAVRIIQELLERGAKVQAHDPKAMQNCLKEFPTGVLFAQDAFEAVRQADGLILVTEWNEYRNIDLARVKALMRGSCIVDARNLLDSQRARDAGFHYQGVGR
jgi:UDPglucose 6-dehydrogenase